MKNQFARDIYQEYYRRAQTLVNTYCQLKASHPFESWPKLAQEIWMVQTLVYVWATIAKDGARDK